MACELVLSGKVVLVELMYAAEQWRERVRCPCKPPWDKLSVWRGIRARSISALPHYILHTGRYFKIFLKSCFVLREENVAEWHLMHDIWISISKVTA